MRKSHLPIIKAVDYEKKHHKTNGRSTYPYVVGVYYRKFKHLANRTRFDHIYRVSDTTQYTVWKAF